MFEFAGLPLDQRLPYFQEVANRRGLTRLIVEKDFWVCFSLRLLFSTPIGKRQEIVVGVFLNGQNKPLGEKEITEGTPTQASLIGRDWRIAEGCNHPLVFPIPWRTAAICWRESYCNRNIFLSQQRCNISPGKHARAME